MDALHTYLHALLSVSLAQLEYLYMNEIKQKNKVVERN